MVDALPSGSYVVLSHADESLKPLAAEMGGAGTREPFCPRSRLEISEFLAGLEMLHPGVVSVVDWLPEVDPKPCATASEATMYGAIARKH